MALEQNAISILLIHNHPSGKLTPSKQDIEITNQIKQAGKQLEISVLDHLIITENAYYSFNDDGKL
jgi:DNA repair protein RadC